jgi:NhaP-type Na+/H+ or K+/H+ antiporter
MLLIDAVTGLIVAGCLPLQLALTSSSASFDFATIAIIGILFGVLAGFLGGRFITMMNALAPAMKGA